MDPETELEILFRNAVALVDQYYRLPRVPFLKDPITAAGDWARNNPGQAHRLVTQVYELIGDYFSRKPGR